MKLLLVINNNQQLILGCLGGFVISRHQKLINFLILEAPYLICGIHS